MFVGGRFRDRIGFPKPIPNPEGRPLMKLTLLDQLAQFTRILQGILFPTLREELGPLTDKHQQVVAVLNMIHLEAFIGNSPGGVGRPLKDRRAIARAFVAKAVYNTVTCVPHEHDAATVGTVGGGCGFAADLRLGGPAGNSA